MWFLFFVFFFRFFLISEKVEYVWFFCLQEAELAFYNKQIALHTRILVRTSKISSYFNDEQ
ncbi:hypothetical protein OC713_02455, partial [Sweet potato little leaf phytoplasma]|nr:hypothetical protein [Sweet potato little leaf phytoplasma]